MVDLTKSINGIQTAITTTMKKTTAPKTETILSETAQKVAEDIRKLDAITEATKAQAMANIPDYVYNIAKHLNRQ